MTFPNFTEISIDHSKFDLPPDFITEAWDISQRGDFVVGTTALKPPDTIPPPSPFAGTYWAFAGPISIRFEGGKLKCTSDPQKVDAPLGAVASSAHGCNDMGDVVGFYRNAQDKLQGFVRLVGMASKNFLLPRTDLRGTDLDQVSNGVLGINNQRVVVGVYKARNATREVGFVAHADDSNIFKEIDLGANDPTVDSTRINAISSDGRIVGAYRQNGSWKPFRWQVQLTAPFGTVGAVPQKDFDQGTSMAAEIMASGINDLGHIVGFSNPTNDPNAPIEGFLWHTEPAVALREHFNFSDGTPPKTIAGGISLHSIMVGARRTLISASVVRRRAYVCVFADWVKVLEVPSGPRDLLTVPLPTMPFPFPNPFWPVWNAFYGAQNRPHEGHNAMVGLLMNELISSITDEEWRRRLRAEVLDMVLKEVRKLSDKEY